MIDMSTDQIVFWTVVAARILIPLAVFRFPLPAMLAALVVDGLDQTIFQTFTSLPLDDYQSYDKALDVYYLSLAYLSMMRNWVSRDGFDVGRFLYYYRLVGVVLFEQTQIRALLLVLPNTFEYFFDSYEGIRTRWDPRRLGRMLLIGIAAFIWIFIKLPQEWWIHVAELDATDLIKTKIFGVDSSAAWTDAIAARPWVLVVVVAVVVALVLAARWVILHRLPPADHAFTLDADVHQPMVEGDAIDRERRLIVEHVVSLELLEKVVLTGLVTFIFSRMLPGADPAAIDIIVGVGIVVVLDTLISRLLILRGDRPHGAVLQFAVTLAVNLAIVAVAFVIGTLSGLQIQHAIVFVLLISVIVTGYDRYRPLYKARFANGPLRAPG